MKFVLFIMASVTIASAKYIVEPVGYTSASDHVGNGYQNTPVYLADAAPEAYPTFNDHVSMPMPFNFAWSVNDGPSYNYYGHQSSSNGKVVTGSYHVALPDGRTQIVSYKADDYGYVADVKYEGEAKYPEQKATGYKSVDLIPPY